MKHAARLKKLAFIKVNK